MAKRKKAAKVKNYIDGQAVKNSMDTRYTRYRKAADESPGVKDGVLVDPKAYFFALINRREGDPADDWHAVLTASGIPAGRADGVKPKPGEPHYGITQQISPARGVAGRIFLPTMVLDDNGYYCEAISPLRDREGGGLEWEWRHHDGPTYVPLPEMGSGTTGGGLPVPPSGGGADLDAIIQARIEEAMKPVEAAVYRQGTEIAALRDKMESAGGGGQQLPKRIALKGDHGRYLTAENDGRVSNRETEPAGWQQWRLEVVE